MSTNKHIDRWAWIILLILIGGTLIFCSVKLLPEAYTCDVYLISAYFYAISLLCALPGVVCFSVGLVFLLFFFDKDFSY